MMSSNQKGYSPSPISESAVDNYYIKNWKTYLHIEIL
jgi:hypothetical protein